MDEEGHNSTRVMRAGRLVQLLCLLQVRGQMTVAALSAELEVSERTVLRDVEALSGAGVPVYSVRWPQGGVALLGATEVLIPDMASSAPAPRSAQRAVVLLSPLGRRMAVLSGRPAGLRVRRVRPVLADRADWVEASFPVANIEAAVHDLLSFGAEVEVRQLLELRTRMADIGAQILARHT